MDAENQCVRCGRYLYGANEAETAEELYRLTGARFPETREIAVVLIGEQKHAASPQIASEIERLRTMIHGAYEVYAGMEGVPIPETACEAYLLRIIEQMAIELCKGEGE